MSFYDDASLVFLPSGQAGKDGKAYSIKPVPEYGSELVTNGDFATDSDWIKGTGWTISGGTANCDGTQTGNTLLYQNIGHSSNTLYRLQFTISNYVSGTIDFALDNPFFGAANSNGTFVFDITPSSVGNFIVRADENFVGSIDNVSVKEITTSGDFTFSRGSNLTATRVDSNGLIEKGRENLLLQSNQFDTTWQLTNAPTLTSGQSGYDGTNDAWKLEATTTGSSRSIHQIVSSSGVQVFSVYVKAGTTDWIRLNLSGIGNRYFDIGNGVVGGSGTLDGFITDIGGGWYRCSLLGNGSSSAPYIFLASGNGNLAVNAGDNIYIQDAQLEIGTISTEYIESGATSGLAGILEDSPRFDYSGGASCPSLLLEPSRTNSIKQSEYINGWNFLSNVNVIDNAATSPEGVLNASKIIPTTAAGSQKVLDVSGFNRTSGEYISHTIYAKANGYNYLYLSNSADRLFAVYDLSGGSVDYVSSNGTDFINHSASIESVGNGWYRCALIGEAVTSIGSYLRLSVAPTSETTSAPAYTADGTSGILVYGAQVELNASYPTSYIPNHSGGSVTRNGEQIVNTNISSIINTSNSYTIFFDFTRPNADYVSAWQLIGIDNGGYTSRLKIVQRPNFDQFRVNVYDGTTNATSSEIDNSAQNKIAVVYDGSTSYKIFTNGTLLQTLSCGAINGTRLTSGENGTQKTIDNYQQISLFPTALSNTDCEILTGTSYESFAAMATALNYTTYE